MAAIANSITNPAVTLSLPLVAGNKGASSQDLALLLRNALYGNGIHQMGAPGLSGHSIGSAYVVSDYTMTYRSIEDVLNSVGTGGWFKETFGGPDAALVYQVSGFASGLGAVVGAVQIKRDFESIAYSDSIRDTKGSLLGRISVVKNAALIGGAAGISVFRGLAMFDAVKNISPSFSSASLVGRVTYGALFVGIILYAVFFLFLAVGAALKIYEGNKLQKKLEGKELSEQLKILERMAKADPKAVLQKLRNRLGDEGSRAELIQEALSAGKEALKELMKDLNIDEIPDEQLGEMIEEMLTATGDGKTAAHQLELLGLQIRVQQVDAKKQAKLARILNKEGLEALGSLKGKALVEAIQKSASKKLTEHSILLAIFVFGVITMAAALAFAAGPGLVVASVMMLLFSLMGIGVDGYYLVQSYKGEQPVAKDKKMLIFSTLVAVATLVAILALAASGVVTMGTVPLIAAIILTMIWVGQNGITYAVMTRNEKLHNEKNPTLETFIEALENEYDLEYIRRMRENLSHELKKEISTTDRKGMLDAAREQAQKIEAIKKAQLELLRKALVSLSVRPVNLGHGRVPRFSLLFSF